MPDVISNPGFYFMRLINAAEAYIIAHDLDVEVRFDVIAIAIDTRPLEIMHFEEAFYPTL